MYLVCNHEFTDSSGEFDRGCWYCGSYDDKLLFSTEWDTFVHLCCIGKARELDPKDIEALVFAKEFSLD